MDGPGTRVIISSYNHTMIECTNMYECTYVCFFFSHQSGLFVSSEAILVGPRDSGEIFNEDST